MMKLSISILLNVVLAACLTTVLMNQRRQARATTIPAVALESKVAPKPAPENALKSFRWSQLESTNDYRTYVMNLRAVGCPESTIRAIVTADFEAACSFEQQRAALIGESTERFSPGTAKQLVASVLGEPSVSAREGDSRTETTAVAGISHSQTTSLRPGMQATAKASYPLALQDAVLKDAGLSKSQQAAVRQIQQQFVDALGGPNQNPNDPAYGARWQTAQQDADDTLRGTLGTQAYLGYQLQHYSSNFQQVMLNAGDGPVAINPDALAK